MSTYTQVRDAIVGYILPAWKTQYPNTPIYFEDTVEVSLDDVPNGVFLMVSIPFSDSIRQGIDESPATETFGEVNMRLFAREGQGVRMALGVFDFLTETMKYKRLSGVTLDVPKPGRRETRDGWVSRDLDVGFSFFQ